MDNRPFNKKFDTAKLMLELFNHNQFLQAQVTALHGLIGYIMVNGMGESKEDVEEMCRDLTKKATQENIVNNDMGMYSERWNEILGQGIGDIDGISFEGKNPE